MILPPTKTVQINKGQKYHSFCFQIGKTLTFQARSPRGLGSSDLTFWVQEITTSKPLTDLHWPSFWPTHTTENELMGFKKWYAEWKCYRGKGEGEFKTLESSEFPIVGDIQSKIGWLLVI